MSGPGVRGSLALLTDLYEITMAYGYWKTGRHRVEAVKPTSIGNELGALGFEHIPYRLIGQFRMSMNLGVGNAFVEQPGV